MAAVTMTVRCVSMIVRSARWKPASIAERGLLPTRSSSRMRSKMRMLVSTAMPIVSAMPAMPGSVSVAPNAARDALVDPRRRVEVAVEDDGQAAAHVLLGDVPEDAGAGGRELDRHLPVARRVGIGLHLGPRQLGSGQERPLLDHVGHLALGLGLLVAPALGEDLGGLRQPPRLR